MIQDREVEHPFGGNGVCAKFEQVCTYFKVVNLGYQEVVGIDKNIPLNLKEWTWKESFTIFPLDDYKVVLVKEFMQNEKVVLIPCAKIWAIFF
jgi:hypothetical protein